MKASALQKQTYEAKENASGLHYEPARVRKARVWFSHFPAGKVLDVGCGDGAILKPLLSQHEIHGVDISAVAVEQANAAGIRAKQHDLEDPLPFADGFFDSVFCGETIEHQVDTDWLLSEINRVLKVNGQVVLTYPNIRTPVGILMLLLLDMPPMYAARYRSAHYRDFTLRTIKIAMRNNGFEVVKVVGGAFYVPGMGECCETVASIFPRFASTVVLQAKKVANASYKPEEAVAEIY
jgi:SAM-dependent methyltransferase